ncbi:MAG: 4-(cytidine 5'-diphospho)-2-C-methyl-D-erythritol kinase [Chloroflexi bacterium]|nr:4-(cytidine 5'-diphospho)-2-C-methyl-D-erythritol kinase [Chloroflexota bacterium]
MSLKALAPAKVNLTLEVLHRRPDGYHEVRTVLQTIDLSDEITFKEAEDITLECKDITLQGEDNLVLRAALLLKQETACRKGARITLRKGIPVAAGLGGGSSDAAATLRALNSLWGLGLPLERLAELAARLGSDVPFFLEGGTALGEGRGERISPLPDMAETWLVLLKPSLEIPNKTRTMYSLLSPGTMTDGSATAAAVGALHELRRLPPGLLFNAFDEVALRRFPELAEARSLMVAASARYVHLAGAGPCIFSVTEGPVEAGEVAARLRNAGHVVYITHTTKRGC